MTLIPPDKLAPATLKALVEDFVTRDGTDYGEEEAGLDAKVRQVMRSLERGEVLIAFDETTESCTLVTREALAAGKQ